MHLKDIKAGTLLLVNKKSNAKAFCESNKLYDYPKDEWTAIGVVVIPPSHDVYGNECCGVMSLVSMCCKSPQKGCNAPATMYWGIYGKEIFLDKVTPVEDAAAYPYYLPSDFYSGMQCPHDYEAQYHEDFDAGFVDALPGSLGQSPYLNGLRNFKYGESANPKATVNYLADFNGRQHTDEILKVRGMKDYKEWTPHEANPYDYPAASCCDMFCPTGTKQGDWYLPAIGELGYLCARRKEISLAILDAYIMYDVGLQVEGTWYWSSTEYSHKYAMHIDVEYGDFDNYDLKNLSYNVRAWLQVDPKSIQNYEQDC